MKKYRVEYSYTMTGSVVIEADNKELAKDKVDDIPLNELNSEYLDDSFVFDNVKEDED